MKNRILHGWNFNRILYTLIGLSIIVYAITQQEWWSLIIGGYFAIMGILGLGCAAGNCYTHQSYSNHNSKSFPSSDPNRFDKLKQQ